MNLVDLKKDVLVHAIELVKSNLKTLADHGHVILDDVPAILSRIHPTTDLADAVKEVEFVLEAVDEIPEVKKKVFEQLGHTCRKGTVPASNTSWLDIFNLVVAKDPSRLVVAYWFAPPIASRLWKWFQDQRPPQRFFNILQD